MTKDVVCTVCGYTGKPKRMPKGNILIEIILWLCFIVPGAIYTLWRFFTRFDACPKCNKFTVISADSPMGQKLTKELGIR